MFKLLVETLSTNIPAVYKLTQRYIFLNKQQNNLKKSIRHIIIVSFQK